MTPHTESSGFGNFLRWLAAHRLAIYAAGLLAIATPRLLRATADIGLGPTLRTAIVVVSLGVMILTYIGEQRNPDPAASQDDPSGTGSEPDRATATAEASGERPRYSRRTRAIFAAGIIGVVSGIYVALEVSVPAGLLFVFGAILFVQSAYRRERDGTESTQ